MPCIAISISIIIARYTSIGMVAFSNSASVFVISPSSNLTHVTINRHGGISNSPDLHFPPTHTHPPPTLASARLDNKNNKNNTNNKNKKKGERGGWGGVGCGWGGWGW